MFTSILFDFDGTLMDSSEGVFNSFDKVVEFYGLEIDREIYRKMIGPPLKESFSNFFHLPESEIPNAIAKYREHYSARGMFEARIYDGVEDLLKALRNSGKRIFVATSKPEVYAKKILERAGIAELFDFIGGSDLEEKTRVEKIDVINYVLSSTKMEGRKDECLMVGDRFYDVKGAHEAGLKCAGILWGFGSREEFRECGADFVLATPREAAEFLVAASS